MEDLYENEVEKVVTDALKGFYSKLTEDSVNIAKKHGKKVEEVASDIFEERDLQTPWSKRRLS